MDNTEKSMTVDKFNKLPSLLKGGYIICYIKPTGMTVEQYWIKRKRKVG